MMDFYLLEHSQNQKFMAVFLEIKAIRAYLIPL